MIRRWLVLFLTLFLTLHLAGPSMAAAPEDFMTTAVGLLDMESGPLAEEPNQADETVQPTSVHCSTSCHEHCKGFAYTSFGGLSASRQVPRPGPTTNGFAGLVDKIVPPPQ